MLNTLLVPCTWPNEISITTKINKVWFGTFYQRNKTNQADFDVVRQWIGIFFLLYNIGEDFQFQMFSVLTINSTNIQTSIFFPFIYWGREREGERSTNSQKKKKNLLIVHVCCYLLWWWLNLWSVSVSIW